MPNLSSTIRLIVLISSLTALTMIVGQAIAGTDGLIFALISSIIIQGITYWNSDKIALSMNSAVEINEEDYPQLFSITRKLINRANLPLPKLYITPEAVPNAFATGRDAHHASIAVTKGLLEFLSPEELEGVIAHELGHIKNKDVFISTIAVVMAGTISSITQFAYLFGSLNRGRDEDGQNYNPIVMLIMVILAPLLAFIIQMAISRSREYRADQTAIDMTFNPNGLANALQKINEISQKQKPQTLRPAFASLYTANPFTGDFLVEMMSTHPSIEKRVERIYSRTTN